MVIGYSENYIGPDEILLLFYRRRSKVSNQSWGVEERWVLSHKLRVHKSKREGYLQKLLGSGVTLRPLARGT